MRTRLLGGRRVVLALAGVPALIALMLGLAVPGVTPRVYGQAKGDQALLEEIFPPDPREVRDQIVAYCTACHGLGLIIVGASKSAEEWKVTLEWHRNLVWTLGEEEFQRVEAYLVKYFNPERKLPEEIPSSIMGRMETY